MGEDYLSQPLNIGSNGNYHNDHNEIIIKYILYIF